MISSYWHSLRRKSSVWPCLSKYVIKGELSEFWKSKQFSVLFLPSVPYSFCCICSSGYKLPCTAPFPCLSTCCHDHDHNYNGLTFRTIHEFPVKSFFYKFHRICNGTEPSRNMGNLSRAASLKKSESPLFCGCQFPHLLN